MTGRERLQAVLAGERTDAFPVVVPYLGIFLRDHWSQATEVPWWAVQAGDVKLNLQVTQDLQEKLNLDWVQVGRGPSRAWREQHRVELRGDKPFLVDEASGQVEPLTEPPVGGVQSIISSAWVQTLADVEKAVSIVPAADLLANGSFDHAQAVRQALGPELFILGAISAPFWGLYQYFGFNGMMINLIQHPKLVENLLEKLTLHHLEVLRAYAALGFDGVWVEDCYSSADLISGAHFRRFAAPYVGQLIAEINRLGMKSIYYFCGDVSDRLEDLVGMQPHALSLEESKKGFVIDIAAVDEKVADRTCLFGNFDAITLLEKGDLAEIAAEVERQLAVGRSRGRFVSSLGSPVTPRTPTDRVREWVELVRERSEVGTV